MKKASILFGVLLVVVSVAKAAGLDMDLMQTVEDTNKSLSSNIALQDASASTKDAQELHELFKVVEGHYQSKPEAPDGLELSRKSLQLTEQIIKQVGAKDFTGASDSSTALSRTCRACHTFYKQS
ncbi:MAG: hypothetical protein ACOYNB_12315 [Aquabacterium sp.]|uniref:hypothetical protein n=1 Tax=Aquabacterium sp. TaxID=1872578 RepID=UPI003BDD443E